MSHHYLKRQTFIKILKILLESRKKKKKIEYVEHTHINAIPSCRSTNLCKYAHLISQKWYLQK